MYEFALAIHSWLRWAALAAGVVATFSAFAERGDPSSHGRTDRWGLILVVAIDLQLLLGLLLYFVLSPNTSAIFGNFGAAMRDPVARFWAIEHVVLMALAVVLVHLGRVLARKAPTPRARRKRLFLCFGMATVAMIAGTPWPGMSAGRPFFRV
jgi:hypothetical protein